ncbi:MAG: DoxX family protein [Pseudomonadota bacterium]
MNLIKLILQIIIALGIINVWVFRFGKATAWRGGSASNMKEEFAAYGLSVRTMYVVGFLKLLCALFLFVGIWIPGLVKPSAGLIALLMLGAVAMHFKISDQSKKSSPAAMMLLMSLLLVIL